MSNTELVLIDLSSIAYPIYLTSQSHADPDHASHEIVARVRALANDHPHAAVCCDSGRSFRADLASSYKANRPESQAPYHHQVALAKEQLAADGFPVWSVRTFEADDLIATATKRALDTPDLSVLIVTADKDLLQLVGPRVRALSARDGSILDADAVRAKYGVGPEQMCDYLMLVGDSSDNVKGADKIGAKTAAGLLATFGTLEAAYKELALHPTKFKPSIASSLQEFRQRMDVTRSLITLRTDVDLPFEEIVNERTPQASEPAESFDEAAGDEPDAVDGTEDEDLPPMRAPMPFPTPAPTTTTDAPASEPEPQPAASSATGLMRRESTDIAAPVEWELQPHTLRDARILATDMHKSHMFSAYGSQEAVLATIMVGRELGIPAMASLRGINNIEGKHALSAALMVALVLKSKFAEYFEPVSFDDRQATFETHRRGARKPVTLTHTIEMAVKAGLVKDKSGWVKNPTDMLVARAQARLARLVYPDLLGGLYTPEELEEIRLVQVA